MEHLLAADVLVGDQAALPIVFGGATNNVAPNVFYLAARVVDKLWQGWLTLLYSFAAVVCWFPMFFIESLFCFISSLSPFYQET